MKSERIICTGKGTYNCITECDGVIEGIEENIIYEEKNFNKFIEKVKYAVCPKNDKVIIRMCYFKENNKITIECLLNLEKMNLEEIIYEKYKEKKYYYKNYVFVFDSTSDTWENVIKVIGNNTNETIFGDASADSSKELQNKDYLNMLNKAKEFIDNKLMDK